MCLHLNRGHNWDLAANAIFDTSNTLQKVDQPNATT